MLIFLLAWIFSCIIIHLKNPETSEITRFNSIYALKGHEKSERGFISNSCTGWGLNWAFLAWENSRHFSMPSMVSMRHNVWQTRANIPYWRRVTTQMWVVFLIGHAVRQTSTSKKHYPELGCDKYGISALVSQTSFPREISGGVARRRFFSQSMSIRFVCFCFF